MLAVLLCMGILSGSAAAFSLNDVTQQAASTKIVYGYSGSGRELTAYKFGNGSNVMVVGFAIHGFEDNFNRDGICLVYTANELMKKLQDNMRSLTYNNWTVYVLPCMNPDGLLDGITCNGAGRCTTSYYNSAGTLVHGTGIDLNRAFPKNWIPYTGTRNFNGSAPLAAPEARALAAFIQQVKGTGTNICIDTHGWFQQIITSNGTNNKLYEEFAAQFPNSSYANCTNSKGYFTTYAASLGYLSCLFEFPYDVYSESGFKNSGYCEKYCKAVLNILNDYGAPTGHYTQCPAKNFYDVSPTAWYHESVDYVLSNGLMNGVSANSFRPNQNMTRAMLVTTLYRLYFEPETKSVSIAPDDAEFSLCSEGFSDVPEGKWYSDAVEWAQNLGLVKGFNDNTFRPDEPVTREQLATILYRYSTWCGRELQSSAPLSDFPDGYQTSPYAVTPLSWAYGKGLINGVSDGFHIYLSPKGTATRAQTAAILMRYRECTHGDYLLDISDSDMVLEAAVSIEDDYFGDLGGN